MTDKVTVEIDGRVCEATPGEMIIAVADREGIVIPRFCYHKKLSVAANCRMCLVEAEQGGRPFPKPVPACATGVVAGMKVQTRSPKALEAQRGTMEFLLINHPLDCPICDQGGECELQDVAMGYGGDASRYAEGKRVVKDEDLGPLIATDMTRCIHCTRCVRFGAEVAGLRELGATGRGEDMRIGTFVAHTVSHELSGNIIDLCPVGALTSKPYRFKARSWELTQADGIAPHDALGSNIHLHIRGTKVMRVHPRENEAINETWISDRDRFSYEALASADRLLRPMAKRDGEWQVIEWSDALDLAADRLKAAGEGLAALVSPSATLEEMYLAGRVARGLGSNNIDTRLRQQDFRGDEADPALPWLGVPIAQVPALKGLLLVGCDLRQEQPLLAHRVREAAMGGGMVALVNPLAIELNFPATQLTATPAGMLMELAAVAKALGHQGSGHIAELIGEATVGAAHSALAEGLKEAAAAGRGLILLGALAAAHPDYTLIKALCYDLAVASGVAFGFLPAGANGAGAPLAGAVPHLMPGAKPAAAGAAVDAMLATPRAAYLLWGLELSDLGNPAAASATLSQGFVVACTAFRSAALDAVADLMLPIAAFAETSGTFVNAELVWQGFRGVVPPPGEARPGWKVLRVLGNRLGLEGFEYRDSKEVGDEIRALSAHVFGDNTPRGEYTAVDRAPADGITRIGRLPIYAIDALVRRAPALQRTPLAAGFAVTLHPSQATSLGLTAGDQVAVRQNGSAATAELSLDPRIPVGCALIPAGVAGSEALGPQIGPVTINKV